jgi:hypothetical protein
MIYLKKLKLKKYYNSFRLNKVIIKIEMNSHKYVIISFIGILLQLFFS